MRTVAVGLLGGGAGLRFQGEGGGREVSRVAAAAVTGGWGADQWPCGRLQSGWRALRGGQGAKAVGARLTVVHDPPFKRRAVGGARRRLSERGGPKRDRDLWTPLPLPLARGRALWETVSAAVPSGNTGTRPGPAGPAGGECPSGPRGMGPAAHDPVF